MNLTRVDLENLTPDAGDDPGKLTVVAILDSSGAARIWYVDNPEAIADSLGEPTVSILIPPALFKMVGPHLGGVLIVDGEDQ